MLKDRFVGRRFEIRNFYSGSHLRYDGSGHIKHSAEKGDWTIAQFRVERVKARAADFELSGSRIAVVYDERKDRVNFSTLDALDIKVDLPAAAITESKLDELTNEIFVDLKKEPDKVPDYWRDLVSENVASEIGKDGKKTYRLKDIPLCDPAPPSDAVQIMTRTSQGIPIYSGTGRVKPAIEKKTPDPSFSDLARRFKYQGTTVMSVTISEEGNVEHISMLRPLGLGLDERAVDAVKTWTFIPAKLDDKPVKVMANIEVTFRLYN